MPVADDWKINFTPFVAGGLLEMIHIDGILSYDGNTGTAPSLNDYIFQASTGAAGRVIAGSDLGGVAATGTLTLANIVGRFADNGALEVLSEVPFDTVGGTPQGFSVGDALTGPTTEAITIRAYEYNEGPKKILDGEGVIYGNAFTAGFADNEAIGNSTTGGVSVALVNGTESNNSALFTGALANGTLAVPGTANTNNSAIIHYDAGTIDIPVEATVADAVTGAVGQVASVIGVPATGSLRLVDSNTTAGAWTDNNALNFNDVVFYNAQVAGQVFQEGAVYEGQISLFRFRVLKIIDDGDSTGKLITAGKQGALTLNEDLHIRLDGDILGAKIAQVESTTTILAAATLNIPGVVRTEQRSAAGIINQGGIFGSTVSLNIVRRSNEFFSYIKGTLFPQVAQLDDKPALDGNVKNSLYTILSSNNWSIPSPSFKYLDKGNWQDSGKNNIYTNYAATQAEFTGIDITNSGFLYTATNPTPMPQAYVVQGTDVLPTTWLEGPFDVILKNKSTTDVRFITPATPALGQLVNAGAVEWFSRPYGRLYSLFDNSALGQKGTIVLSNKNDSNNKTGQYQSAFTLGGAGAFTVGEEISTTDGTKIGIVFASGTGAAANVDFSLKSDTQFVNTDVVTGAISGKSATLGTPTNLVAGYSTNIRVMVIDILADSTPAPVITGTFFRGEPVTQAVTGATGFLLKADTADGNKLYIQTNTGTFSGDNNITGDTSAASWNPGVTTQTYNAQTTVPFDLGEGTGNNNYAGASVTNITGADKRPVLELYEYSKFLTDEQSKSLQGGRGVLAGKEGRVYRGLDPTFAEKPESPYGTFAAGIMSAAEANFIVKEDLVAADIQNLRVTPIGSIELIPPNLQNAQTTNIGPSGWAAFFYRSTGVSSLVPLTNEFQVGAGNLAANSTIVYQAGTRTVSPLPSDVPDTGVCKFEDPSNPGIFLRGIYDSVNRTTNTFSLQQGIGQNTIGDITGGAALIQGDDAWVAIVEELAAGATASNSVQFVANFDAVGGARKKGFDDFEQATVFDDKGATVNVNQTPDGVVDLP